MLVPHNGKYTSNRLKQRKRVKNAPDIVGEADQYASYYAESQTKLTGPGTRQSPGKS
jgi:hypothetical protein